MTARIWEASSGKELAVLRGHEWSLSSAVFSTDGMRVLTASNDGTARLWDASGKQLAVLRGHEGDVNSAVFSADGTRVLTASWDKTARLWEASSGKELAVLRGHEGPVSSAVFPFANTQMLIDYACSIMPRPLIREQRRRFFLEDVPEHRPCGWSTDQMQKPAYLGKAKRKIDP